MKLKIINSKERTNYFKKMIVKQYNDFHLNDCDETYNIEEKSITDHMISSKIHIFQNRKDSGFRKNLKQINKNITTQIFLNI